MAKRIATQLKDEIEAVIEKGSALGNYFDVPVADVNRWLQWAKRIDARMRIDGSELSKQRKPKKAILKP